jgi:hypothetical protein
MKYALFRHTQDNLGLVNIGDHVQSCAAEQFLPQTDFFVDRERLNTSGYDVAKIIMNGWFTDSPENWPPNPNLIPLFISFHLQPSSAKIILRKKENIDYLKMHSPIGCRDYKTLELLQEKGIDSYFSFCLTTTLGETYKTNTKTGEIYLVDPLYNYDRSILSKVKLRDVFKKLSLRKLKKLKDYFSPNARLEDFLPDEILSKGIVVNHYVSSELSNEELYNTAKTYIKNYASAKLVITSRIHCALPCLALGTPVLFLMEGLTDESLHMSRFRGILDHINILTNQSKAEFEKHFGSKMNVYSPNEIDWNNPPQNPKTFEPLSNELIKRCNDFIKS